MTDLPVQPSLRRLREHDVRPRRDLGQNFLIDSNILGVIERAADLEPHDGASASAAVALEIGYRAFGDSACTAAAREGIEAFFAGRSPDFGRTG